MPDSSPPPLLAVARRIDDLIALFGRLCAWMTLFLVFATAIVVVLRYGFSIGAVALQEAVMYAHALVFMGASAWAMQRGAHVRVDILHQKFSPRRKALVDLLGHLFLLLPVCLFLAWNSWDYVTSSWATREVSNEASGLKFVYLQKSIILVLVVGLVVQALSELIKCIYLLAGRIPEESTDSPSQDVEIKHV